MQNFMPNAQNIYPYTQGVSQAVNSQPLQNPNYAGVNIQIINPMVNPQGGMIYPTQTASAYENGVNGGCYPSNYYTTQPASGYVVPNAAHPNLNSNISGFYDNKGKYYPYVKNNEGEVGYYDENGSFHPLKVIQDAQPQDSQNPQNNEKSAVENADNIKEADKSINTPNSAVDGSNTDGKKNVEDINKENSTNGENSADKAAETNKNNQNNVTNEVNKGDDNNTKNDKKTEKKEVVLLSDEYIKSLENYLNSQDLEIRKMGAHKVLDRLEEDHSRKDDPALTPLVNKMLQDPSEAIRIIALSIIESGLLSGNNETAQILKNMQSSSDGFGLDATQASSALLKMAEKKVEKEVPVKDSEKKEKAEK